MRTNWSLRIQNFGRISEAEIQISPMILFVGDNSSGKSYLMSLLWGMMEANYYDYLNIEECKNWEVYQNARAVFVNTVLQKEKNGALTNEEKRIFVQFFNVFFMENKEEILSSIFNGNIEGEFFEIKLLDKNQFNLDQQKIKLWRQELDKTVEHRKEKLFLRGVMNCCLQILFSDLIGDVDKPKGALFLPASRTGFMLTYKTLINESLKQHFGHKKMQGSIFTKPVIQFLNQIVAMGDEADNEYDDIIRYIEEEVIRGKVVTDHAPIKNIYFASEGMQEQIPLYLTSSLVTELSSILLFLRDKKTPFKTLIIEEPEEHLHLKAQSMMAKIEHSNIGTLDEYYENAEPDKVEQLVEEVKKPALPEPKECELVARELAKNQVEKISDVRSRLNMTWLQIWPIICYMEEQGILEKGKEGTVTLTRTPEQVEELVDSQQWKQLFGEEEAKRRSTGSSQETEEKMQVIRRIQKEKRNNPGVNAITIDQKLVYEETEHHIKTRIPYRKNEFIWLDKSEISWINDHKTIFAGLEKKKEYAILDLEDRFLRKTSGEDLYRESYDPVHRERARQEQEKIRRRREQNYRKAQQNLEAGRRTIQGQRR